MKFKLEKKKKNGPSVIWTRGNGIRSVRLIHLGHTYNAYLAVKFLI